MLCCGTDNSLCKDCQCLLCVELCIEVERRRPSLADCRIRLMAAAIVVAGGALLATEPATAATAM